MVSMNSVLCFLIWTSFGLQHSILARPSFKSLIRKTFGEIFEKNFLPVLYFLSQCILFLIASDLVRNLKPEIIFYALDQKAEIYVYCLNRVANLFLILTVFHFDIANFIGINQLLSFFLKKRIPSSLPQQPINKSFLYRYIRHPMYLGIILVYITSTTVYSDVYLATLFSIFLYIDVGSFFEEKTLVRKYGQSYLEYQLNTKKYIPFVR